MSNGVFAVMVAPSELNRFVARGHAGAWRHWVIAGFATLACALCSVTAVFAAPVLRSGAVGVAPGISALGFPPAMGTVLYDDTGNPANTYYAGQNGAEAVDDVHMVSGGALGTVVFEYYEPVAGPAISATVRIYTNPGGADGDLIPLAGPYVIQVPAAGRGLATVSLPDRPVAGANLWVGVQFSTTTAGLIIKDVPSVGTSHDLYFENGNIFSFGGTPKANFALRVVDVPTFGLGVTIVGQGTVTKSPDQASYAEGTIVQLTAAAAPNWHFAGWSVDASGSANPLDVTMDAAKSVTATFAIDTHVLGVTIVGQGTVTRSPDQAAYDHGSVVQLSATAAVGWHFVGWSGAATGSVSPLEVTMDAARSVTATFDANSYALSVAVLGQGTVTKSPDQAAYDPGTVVQLTAVPALGSYFVGWTGDASGSANPIGITMDAARSVTAVFAGYTYTLSVMTLGQGTVSWTPNQSTYSYGDIVQLTATPAPGWHLVGWTGDAFGFSSPFGITIKGSTSVTATFSINTYPLSVATVGQGTVTRVPDQAFYGHGTVVRLTATPAAGWNFIGWSGGAAGSANPLDLTMFAARSVTATFSATNLVTNGSFDSNLNGWNGYNAVLAWVAGGMGESKAVRVTGPSPGVDEFGLNDSPSWVADAGPAGTTYEISAYVRSTSSTSPVRMRIREYDNGVPVGSRVYSSTQPLTNDWQRISMQYVTRATGTSLDYQVLNLGQVAGESFLIDSVSILNLDPGPSVALTILSPTAPTVLTAGAYCLVRWSLPGTPVDSTVVSATLDGGESWSVIGSEQGNILSWHLPGSPTQAVLFVQAYSNGVVVGDAVSDLLNITAGTLGSDDQQALPSSVYLSPPHPAPLTTQTTLNFGLPTPANVHIQVVDLQGRVVSTLAKGALGAGRHDVTWDGTASGRSLEAGIYFIRLDALGHRVVRKLAITR